MISTIFRCGLGNNMYQYAFIRSVAERCGYDYCVIGDDKQFRSVFKNLKFFSNIKYNFKPYLIEQHYNIKEEFYNLKDDTITNGFFQNYNYFNREDVKNWFDIVLTNTELLIIKNFIELYNPQEYCYINFRGKEFLKISKYITPPDFFEKAKKESGCTKFVVITDDVENAKKYIKAEDYLHTGIKTDLKLLTLAKNLIIPKWSTFSWWGGIYLMLKYLHL
jgi:hypothetical protein